MSHTVYILYSNSLDRYYIGETADIKKRLYFHKNSPARKFTGKADDWELFFEFDCESKMLAKKIEAHIKRMKSRKYIQDIKTYPEIILRLKTKYS